jgi:hypothetical protein
MCRRKDRTTRSSQRHKRRTIDRATRTNRSLNLRERKKNGKTSHTTMRIKR